MYAVRVAMLCILIRVASKRILLVKRFRKLKLAAILCSTFETLFQFESELQDRIANCAFLPFDKGKTHTHTQIHTHGTSKQTMKKRDSLFVCLFCYTMEKASLTPNNYKIFAK